MSLFQTVLNICMYLKKEQYEAEICIDSTSPNLILIRLQIKLKSLCYGKLPHNVPHNAATETLDWEVHHITSGMLHIVGHYPVSWKWNQTSIRLWSCQ